MQRRTFSLTALGALGALGAATLGVAGCATFDVVPLEIATYGEWPPGRAAGSFVFDRLPSQQADPQAIGALETAARPALERAGFRLAEPGQAAEFSVQLAMRTTRTELDPWADPLWWRGGFAGRRRPWVGPAWQLELRSAFPRVDREVALLIRDAASGRPLMEARASHEGTMAGDARLAAAMFHGALIDFPRSGPNPRQVTVPY